MGSNSAPLPVIQIAKPCDADWNAMKGDERSRFCEHCQRYVHNFSAMREEEITDLVCRSAGKLRIRIQRDAAGTMVTLDYEKRRNDKRTRRWILFGALGSALASTGVNWWDRRHRTLTCWTT